MNRYYTYYDFISVILITSASTWSNHKFASKDLCTAYSTLYPETHGSDKEKQQMFYLRPNNADFGYMAVSLLKRNCLKPPKETSKQTEHFHQLLGWILSKSKSCLLL